MKQLIVHMLNVVPTVHMSSFIFALIVVYVKGLLFTISNWKLNFIKIHNKLVLGS